MELVVDLERVTVVLMEADVVDRLTVRVASPADATDATPVTVHRLGDVLAAAYVGRLDDGGDAFVRQDALRFHAAGQVGPSWEERFALRCAAATEAGSPDGALRAAVVWPVGGAET